MKKLFIPLSVATMSILMAIIRSNGLICPFDESLMFGRPSITMVSAGKVKEGHYEIERRQVLSKGEDVMVILILSDLKKAGLYHVLSVENLSEDESQGVQMMDTADINPNEKKGEIELVGYYLGKEVFRKTIKEKNSSKITPSKKDLKASYNQNTRASPVVFLFITADLFRNILLQI